MKKKTLNSVMASVAVCAMLVMFWGLGGFISFVLGIASGIVLTSCAALEEII